MAHPAEDISSLNIRSPVHSLGIRAKRPLIIPFFKAHVRRTVKRYDKKFSHGEEMFKRIEEFINDHQLTEAEKELIKLNSLFIEQVQDFYRIYYALSRLRSDTVKDLKKFLDSHKVPPDVREKYFGKTISKLLDMIRGERMAFNRVKEILAGKSNFAQEIINFSYSKSAFAERWAIWSDTKKSIKDLKKQRKIEHSQGSSDILQKLDALLYDEFDHINKIVRRLINHITRVLYLSRRATGMIQKAAFGHEIPEKELRDQKYFELQLQELLLNEVHNLQKTILVQLSNEIRGVLS
ncbi:hypothetical protein D6774_04395 [Candidatus Woesearchaeota archaeon]|nr:MAG: hypothetical protein D6774_04395 [Candidatus Woesearchaeota archaeon]